MSARTHGTPPIHEIFSAVRVLDAAETHVVLRLCWSQSVGPSCFGIL